MLNLTPRMSEKAYQQSLLNNTYIFVVPKDSNKLQIKTAVQAQFNVSVIDVNIVVQNGKKARSIRLGNRRARPIIGSRSDFKKAYVRLKEGDSIKIFEEEGDK
ncbi:50S ribosomal protein L23 [Candidatus Saccharibacteria bacterium]|jgi:large subunit ribosomal protein L23|nr:50S ribosomal protein L23 [Candidatus Saccharibacteria bacterium]